MDVGLLDVRTVIIHRVPKTGEGDGPEFSDVVSPVTTEIRNFFRERMGSSLRKGGMDVEFDPASRSPLPDLVKQHLNGSDQDIVPLSWKAAEHLFQVQNRQNPGGLLAVVEGTLGGARCLAILKLEEEAAVRLEAQGESGQRTFNLLHLRDLVLSDKVRVFKLGLFSPEHDVPDGIAGKVCDTQQGSGVSGVARFFLAGYLGCRFTVVPAVATKSFFAAAESFVNSQVEDPLLKTRYELALLTELTSFRTEVNPADFAKDYLAVSDRQTFLQYLGEQGAPVRPFHKDPAMIENRLRKMRASFASGIVLLAPPDRFDQVIQMRTVGAGRTHVEFEDTLSGVNGQP